MNKNCQLHIDPETLKTLKANGFITVIEKPFEPKVDIKLTCEEVNCILDSLDKIQISENIYGKSYQEPELSVLNELHFHMLRLRLKLVHLLTNLVK